ncbi:hypothetical protein BX600DRAFT_225106 [Xylariales sp. PMI_506]|nr:hypothetical protein BX600DRAFT_225106 [Xylariales sp. PMI_506]
MLRDPTTPESSARRYRAMDQTSSFSAPSDAREMGRRNEYSAGETVMAFDSVEEAQLSYPPDQPESPQHTTTFTTGGRFAPSQHRRQQTVPALSPLRISSPATSPVRGHSRHTSDMPFTGDGHNRRRPDASPGRFAGWLSSNSIPSMEEVSSPDTTPKSRRGATPSEVTPKSTASTTPSRFGFLASSVSALTTRLTAPSLSPISPSTEDEMYHLDIEMALSPPESFAGREAFSPAAYKNLQLTAAGLLHKMQTAYRQRTIALHEVQGERSAEKEETEEMRMRVENLKMQLEHMSLKTAEQEQSMRQLMAELRTERKARHEERRIRERLLTEGSMVNEDLGVDEEERKKWRKSADTIKSDMSFDTDSESVESESIFSRSRSPTIITSAAESIAEYPRSSSSLSYSGRTPTLGGSAKHKSSSREMSTFQKLMKGMTLREEGEEPSLDGCRNCHGQDASMAWDTVSLLRDENKGLKQRVGQLEVAVEGALDLVNGIGL